MDIPKHNRCRAALQPRAFLITILPVLPSVKKFGVLRVASAQVEWAATARRGLVCGTGRVPEFCNHSKPGLVPSPPLRLAHCLVTHACKPAVAWNLNSVPHVPFLSCHVPSWAVCDPGSGPGSIRHPTSHGTYHRASQSPHIGIYFKLMCANVWRSTEL